MADQLCGRLQSGKGGRNSLSWLSTKASIAPGNVSPRPLIIKTYQQVFYMDGKSPANTGLQQLRYAVSFIMYRNDKEFLVVKRPPEDEELGGIWGLPATTFDSKSESPDEAVLRAAREKIGCEIKITRRLPEIMIQQRHGYDLMLMDYECKLVSGEPDVHKAKTTGTKYIDKKWTSDPRATLEAGAKRGSICIQLFLYDKGLWPREKWITKL
jgi:8-oxo-dGTP pyrophosphatase MutT (NUDIX family)